MLYCHQSLFSTAFINEASFDAVNSLHFSASVIAGVATSFYFFYMIMQVLSGLLVSRYGERRMLILAALCVAAGCFTPDSIEPMFLQPHGRMFFGMAALLSLVATITLARNWFSYRGFVFINGCTLSIGALAAFLGEDPISHILPDFFWHNLTLAIGFINLLLAISIYHFIKDESPALEKKRKVPFLVLMSRFSKCCRNSINLLCGIYACLLFLPVGAFTVLWGRPYLMSYYQIDSELADLAGSMIMLGMIFGAPVIAYFSNRLNDRLMLMLVCAIGSLVFMSAILYIPHIPLTIMFLLLLGLGIFISGYSLAFAVVARANSEETVAIAFSITNLLKLIGGAVILQFIATLLAEHWTGERYNQAFVYSLFNFRFSMLLIPICLGLAVIIALLLQIMEPEYGAD